MGSTVAVSSRLVLCLTTALTLSAAAPLHATADDKPRHDAPAQASFSEIVEMVKQNGWRINLGDLCSIFGIAAGATECAVQQISVEEIEGQGYPRGFNVPISIEPLGDVLLYHLNPMVGEFFVVARDGTLKAAFLRSKGTGYERVAIDLVRDEFHKDISYWKNNLSRIQQGLELNRPEKDRETSR